MAMAECQIRKMYRVLGGLQDCAALQEELRRLVALGVKMRLNGDKCKAKQVKPCTKYVPLNERVSLHPFHVAFKTHP